MLKKQNRLKFLKSFYEYFLLGFFALLYLNTARPFTNVLIYQGRDILRAAQIAYEGKKFWFGPELYGGGYLPGAFYYYLISIPIWLTQDLYSVIDLQHLFLTFTALFGFYSIKKSSDLTTALWFYCLFLTIPYTFEFFLQFDNPSFLYPFLVIIFHFLYQAQLSNRQFFLLGFLFSLAAQLHGSASILFSFVLVMSSYLWRPKLRSIFLLIAGFLSTQFPYYIWKFFYRLDEWGSLGNSVNSIYEDAFGVYSDWLTKGEFVYKFKTNLAKNIHDHFFWSPASIVFLTMLAVGMILYFFKKNCLPAKHRILKSFTLTILTIIPTYFYLVAYPGERPRYALLTVFSSLYLFSFAYFEFRKNQLTNKAMSAAGLLLVLMFFFKAKTNLFFWVSGPVIILIIGTYLNAIKKTKALVLPIATLFLVSNQNIGELRDQIISSERKIVSFSGNYYKIQCPQKIRTLHEKGIDDIREFLTISVMEDLAGDILKLTHWSSDYLNQHVSLMGVNQSNEFFSIYKNIYEKKTNLINKVRENEGLLFVFNVSHLCLQKRTQDIEKLEKDNFIMDKIELNMSRNDLIKSFYDMDNIVKNKLIYSEGLSLVSGPFVLIYTKYLEGFDKVNNMGFPYRYPKELELNLRFSESEVVKSGYRSTSNTQGFFFINDCTLVKDFCLVALDIEFKNGKIIFEAKGQSISQPTKNSLPGFTQKWLEPTLQLTCSDGSIHSQKLSESIGNTEFQNHLLGPYKGYFKSPCAVIKNIKLISTRVIRKFEKLETTPISLTSGDYPFGKN